MGEDSLSLAGVISGKGGGVGCWVVGLEAEATEDDLEDDRDRPTSPTEGVVVRSVLGLGTPDMVRPMQKNISTGLSTSTLLQ